jgi:hypothetical protein
MVFLRPHLSGIPQTLEGQMVSLKHVYSIMIDSTRTNRSKLVPTMSTKSNSQSLPTDYALHANYPNPFNPTTEIKFDLPVAGNVSLVIYDVLGRKVAELVNEYREGGYHSATWNAAGQASGVYFARLTVSNELGRVQFTKLNKLMLMK